MVLNIPDEVVEAPGASKYNCESDRPFNGRLLTSRGLTLPAMLAEDVSASAGELSETVNVSARVPTESFRSTVRSWPTIKVRLGMVTSAKPGVVAVIR